MIAWESQLGENQGINIHEMFGNKNAIDWDATQLFYRHIYHAVLAEKEPWAS